MSQPSERDLETLSSFSRFRVWFKSWVSHARTPYSSQEQRIDWTPRFFSQQSGSYTVVRCSGSPSAISTTCQDPLRLTYLIKTFCDHCSAKIRQEETWYCKDCECDVCQKCYSKSAQDLTSCLKLILFLCTTTHYQKTLFLKPCEILSQINWVRFLFD